MISIAIDRSIYNKGTGRKHVIFH